MARYTFPSANNLWARHQKLYVDIFSKALKQLAQVDSSQDDENKISEKLCPILTDVCYKESRKQNYYIRTPDWEKPIQPKTDSELRGGKIRKCPDFTCKCVNHFASCPEEFEIALHVECKLLGTPTSNSWILNKNYSCEGIIRFDSKTHRYGNDASSGIMVGYIVSMNPQQIIKEVNSYQKKYITYNSKLSFQFKNPPVFKNNQILNRQNVNPSSFKLIHLWVDLRN